MRLITGPDGAIGPRKALLDRILWRSIESSWFSAEVNRGRQANCHGYFHGIPFYEVEQRRVFTEAPRLR